MSSAVLAFFIVIALSWPSSGASRQTRIAVINASPSSPHSNLIANAITGTLAKSDAVTLAEREQLELIINEQKLNASQLNDPGTAAKIGGIIGCEYILLSSLTEGVASVRIVDVETSEIIFSDSEIPDSQDDSSLSATASRLADKVLEVLSGEQAVITDVRDKQVIINRGSSSGVRTGSFYRVYTGTKRNSVNIAVIRVKNVYPHFSYCEAVKNGGSISVIRRTDKLEALSKSEADKLIKRKKFPKTRQGENKGDPALEAARKAAQKYFDYMNNSVAAKSNDILVKRTVALAYKTNPTSREYYKLGVDWYKLGQTLSNGEGPEIIRDLGVKIDSLTGSRREKIAQIYESLKGSYTGHIKNVFHVAIESFEKVDYNELPIAASRLAYMYSNGLGVSQDYAASARYYEIAAKNGHVNAQYNLGRMYVKGLGVAQDYTKAAELYAKAAEQGHIEAQTGLGNLYYNGRGVERDYTKAAEFYTKAAANGSRAAAHNLGRMYFLGRGVKQDYIKAAELYRKSAAQDYASSQYELANMYEKGLGVKQDVREAIKFYRQAASNGNEKAREALERLGAK